ncbi:MAG: acylneuraminate cytidylyltransferase family protein [Pseudomonadota bacterium]
MKRSETPKIIALITARGGSKSIPRKNVKMLAGKPLIGWTVEAALQCERISRIIVSTDDQEIADVAKSFGADVPFMRPPSLAQDDSSHISVVLHALEFMRDQINVSSDYILLLQPTSPCRTAADIDNCICIAEEQSADAVVSVCEVDKHPFLTKRLRADGTLEDFVASDIQYLRRQSLPTAYATNGALYLNRCRSLVDEKTFFPKRTFPYIMPPERSIDIDTEWDLYLAGLIMTNQNHSNTKGG